MCPALEHPVVIDSQLDSRYHFPDRLLIGANNKRKYNAGAQQTYAEAVSAKRRQF